MIRLLHNALHIHIGACLIWILWALPADALSGPAYITLQERVLAPRPELLLGDLARIESAHPEEQRHLEAIPVCYAPPAGAVRTVTQDYVLRKLRQQGIGLDRVTLTGSSAVTITTVSEVRSKAEIESLVISALRERVPWDVSGVEIAPPKVINDMVVAVPDATLEVDIPEHQDVFGSTLVHVRAFLDGRVLNQATYRFHVARNVDVLVAKELIPRGTVLTPDGLVTKRVDVSGLDGAYLTDITSVLGQRSTRSLKPGMRLTKHMVEAPPVVERGDRIRLHVRSDTFEITTHGRAMEDGALDSTIRVSLPHRRRVLAQITGPGQAVLLE